MQWVGLLRERGRKLLTPLDIRSVCSPLRAGARAAVRVSWGAWLKLQICWVNVPLLVPMVARSTNCARYASHVISLTPRKAPCLSSAATPVSCARRPSPPVCRVGVRIPVWAGSLPNMRCCPGLPRNVPTVNPCVARLEAARTRSSRLIGRCLRGVVDMKALGENMIQIDCDVLQADGGTRTASVTGAYVALVDALDWAEKHHHIRSAKKVLTDCVSAVSVGVISGTPMLDPAICGRQRRHDRHERRHDRFRRSSNSRAPPNIGRSPATNLVRCWTWPRRATRSFRPRSARRSPRTEPNARSGVWHADRKSM